MSHYYHTKAEVNYRKLVAERKAKRDRSPLEQKFHEVYGKWPTALEMEQVRPYLKVAAQNHDIEPLKA